MKIALRIDDIGASSKEYEVYSKKTYGNFLFLKYLKPLKAWGPYREMSATEWEKVIELLQKYNARLTVGITASWVNFDGTMTPFDQKFPEQLEILKKGVKLGVFEIANHGLTHCVLKDNKFRPHPFQSNRIYHREFWDWIDEGIQATHLKNSQNILERSFGFKPKLLIPPGNVYSQKTLELCPQNGLEVVNCNTKTDTKQNPKILSNENIIAFHDKELVELGLEWLEDVLQKNSTKTFCFVSEFAQ